MLAFCLDSPRIKEQSDLWIDDDNDNKNDEKGKTRTTTVGVDLLFMGDSKLPEEEMNRKGMAHGKNRLKDKNGRTKRKIAL